MRFVGNRQGKSGLVDKLGLRKAFTLVELLVVTGIIAGLAAVVVPALSGARKNALVNVCRGNQKLLYNALSESILGANNLVVGNYHTDKFFGEPYVRPKIANCPDVKEERETALFFYSMADLPSEITNEIQPYDIRVPNKVVIRTYSLSSPAITYYFYADNSGFFEKNPSKRPAVYELTTKEDRRYDSPLGFSMLTNQLHRGYQRKHGANYIFADGHGEWMSHDKLYPEE